MARVQLVLPSFKNAATVLAVVLVVTSVLWKVAAEAGVVLYLVPAAVLSGSVWQLLTWMPADAPVTGSVLFGALITWSTGGSLEARWGTVRFLRFVGVVVFLSGLLTLLTSLVVPALAGKPFFGGMVLASSVWVGFGCSIWNSQTNIFGYPVSGRTFAMLGVLVTALNAVFSDPFLLVAEAWGLVLTFAYALFGFPTHTWTRFRSWLLERDLKKRSSHLKVVGGEQRNTSRDSDKYLH